MKNGKAIKILNEVLETHQRELTDFEERTCGDKSECRVSFIKSLKRDIWKVKRALEELNDDEYLYETVKDFEESVGLQVLEGFRNIWRVARRTKRSLKEIE